VESEQASVFDDAQPVEAADEDLTREVAEGIEAELVAEEPVADDPEDSVFGSYKADEPAVDEPAEEVAVDEPAVDEDSLEETALVDQIDDEPTDVRTAEFFGRPADAPVFEADAPVVPVPAAAAAPAALAGLYRAESDETQVLDTTAERRSIEQEAAEEEARAAALRAEKEERDRRLGMVQTSNANAERELRPQRRGVGGFGSFGLFILRLVTAAILGIVAYQVLYSIDATSEFLAKHPLIPEPRLVSWIVGFTLAAMAVMLVIGLGVRIVGFLLVAIAGLSLAFIRWGNFSPFLDNMEGFIGDKDLLLAAIGILFFSIGGGRFGIDGAISRSRAEAREAKRA
ncbi:MAG: hypothetical protein Q4G35_13500, partial [Propionibacteriaceae bacterium]|nr:hypothetical protein [Propionibacteriaceae bacterium]